MQLTIDIKNESIANKIIQLLEVFKNDGVEIKKISNNSEKESQEYDVEYEHSFEYKLDRAKFKEMKEKL